MTRAPSIFDWVLSSCWQLLALIALVVVLGTGSLFRKDLVAETYFNESVQGLEVGSKVLFRGVMVGNITKLSFTYVKYQQDSPPNQRTPTCWCSSWFDPS